MSSDQAQLVHNCAIESVNFQFLDNKVVIAWRNMQKVVYIKGNDDKAEDAIDLIKISSKNKQIKITVGIVTAMLKQITCKEN